MRDSKSKIVWACDQDGNRKKCDQKNLEDKKDDETETKCVVELSKNWTEMGIRVEGKENRRNTYTPTNLPQFNVREVYRTRI